MRIEVERRLNKVLESERLRAQAAEAELVRLRAEVERLSDEGRRLRMELEDCRYQKPSPPAEPSGGHAGCKCSLDLTDILPRNLELSSLKRSDWRKLFERLVTELMKRKAQDGSRALPAMGKRTDPEAFLDWGRRSASTQDVRHEADRLWELASSNRPRSFASSYAPPPRRDAGDFLSWGRGTESVPALPASRSTREAADFLNFSGPRPGLQPPPASQDANAFLRFTGATGPSAPSTTGAEGRSADDFLAFSSGGSGGIVSAPRTKNLANDAAAFLEFGR